jgi:translation elongation factor EF-Tu-like GTPase
MTMPPAGPAGASLWMTISDVFHIPGRGTVVTGLLEGGVPRGRTVTFEPGSSAFGPPPRKRRWFR